LDRGTRIVRVVFLGTPEVAVPALKSLVEDGHDLQAVVTRPDRPVGRSARPVPPPVKRAAEALGLDVAQPKRVRGKLFAESLRALRPDILVVVAYGRILPRSVLDIAPHGAVNLHFSLLPAYRGAAPVQWALAAGDEVTGVTTMRLNEKMDEGDILLQQEFAVESGEHAPALQSRMAGAGSALLLETLSRLEAGTVEPRPQNHTAASYAPMLAVTDGAVEPDLPARAIEGRVRGFDPWPGVWVCRGGKRLRIIEAVALPGEVADEPGRVLELTQEGLIVACGAGSRLALRRVQPEGRRVLEVRDAVNGRQIAPGDLLERCGAR
jgi:methionyl-tRNA formyltransferase